MCKNKIIIYDRKNENGRFTRNRFWIIKKNKIKKSWFENNSKIRNWRFRRRTEIRI